MPETSSAATSDEQLTREILTRVDEGKTSRNQIARDLGISGAKVSRVAKEHGRVFDTSRTELAIAAKLVDVKEAQATLARSFLIRAQEALDALDSPVETVPQYVSATENESGGWKSTTLDRPSIADQRNLMVIAGVGAQRARDLLATQTSADVGAGVSMLQGLAEAIQRTYPTAPTTEDTDETDPDDPTVLPE